MTKAAKITAWVTIVGSGLATSFVTAVSFFPDNTSLITALGGAVSAIVALILTTLKKEE